MTIPPDQPVITVKLGIRFRVLARDNFTCQYCGSKAPDVRLEVDHVVPRSRGGRTTEGNLITACWACNQGKKARELSAEQLAVFTRPEPVKQPKPAKARKPASTPPTPVRVIYREERSLCANCDGEMGDEWPCPHCGQAVGGYSPGLLRESLTDEERAYLRDWAARSAANKSLGRCQCIRPGEVMGTMCGACLADLVEEADHRKEWADKAENGCDCWECEWCEENQPECRVCFEASRVEGHPICSGWQEYYDEAFEPS